MSEQQATKRPQRAIDEDRYRRHKRKKVWRRLGRRGGRWALWICLYAAIATVIWLFLGRMGSPS